MPEYIDREALFKKFECEPFYDNADRDEIVLPIIDGFPAADVAPVVNGQWDGEGDGYAETEDGGIVIVYDVWRCSKCGYTIDDGTDDPELLPNYCPNCGAKMDLGG